MLCQEGLFSDSLLALPIALQLDYSLMLSPQVLLYLPGLSSLQCNLPTLAVLVHHCFRSCSGGHFGILGGQRPHESQGTGSTSNEFVLYLLKSEIIGEQSALWPPWMSATALTM